jgi:hypothetical protein
MSNMRPTLLQRRWDIEWLRRVHGAPDWTRAAILYGNEDSPARIDCWPVSNPLHNNPPRLTIRPNGKPEECPAQ